MPSTQTQAKTRPINLALVGAPNCGKTATFNVLTGSKAKVANYSGVTVDKRSAILLGHMIEPIFAPIGFTWQMCIALIPGLAA